MSRKQHESTANTGIKRFINEESIGGLLLIGVIIIAVIWSNSRYSDFYHYLWHELQIGFSAGSWELKGSLHYWINDGLIALFFFTIGLEIKREVLAGELSSIKKASLPLMAALGGMIVPATIYAIINYNNPEYIHGWGIPMATDIALALGLMALLGKRVNINLKIFLMALAIADDLGAILVIAIFYTDSIDYLELLQAGFFLIVLIGANKFGVRRTTFYAIVGFAGVWLAILYSGVHATIAGVLIAMTIPVKAKVLEISYMDRLCEITTKFEKEKPNKSSLLTQNQARLMSEIEYLTADANTPLQKLEHALHPVTVFFILPLFALANAGVHIEGNILNLLFHPITIGVILGLVIGKFLGISLFSRIMVWFKLATLPEGVTWKQIYGVGFLAGIGFTMSLFISELAFVSEEFVQIAKVGIFVASFLSSIIGMTILGMGRKNNNSHGR